MGSLIHNFTIQTLHLSTVIFAIAIVHTFLTRQILVFSHKFARGSIPEKIFHFLGEVEVVFGFWAFIFVFIIAISSGVNQAASYVNSLDFSEAIFVFVIMTIAATKPIIQLAQDLIAILCKLFPIEEKKAFFVSTLIFGPLLGSFITEPAAMTVVALLLKENIYNNNLSKKFKYSAIGLLFVNISIGGTLTNFAAPPILVVASTWNWSSFFVFKNFGIKSILSIIIGTILFVILFKKEFEALSKTANKIKTDKKTPFWIKSSNLIFIIITVLFHHYTNFYIATFLFFLGWHEVTKEYQGTLKIKESLLVAFFLGGLVTLGSLQGWWLQSVITMLPGHQLFLGSTLLTAITDNAAITYLASLVTNLSDSSKYYIMAGAVAGGGLTVIANAPNPSGYGILKESFGRDGISPLMLFLGALPFTTIAVLSFWLL